MKMDVYVFLSLSCAFITALADRGDGGEIFYKKVMKWSKGERQRRKGENTSL